MAANLAWYAGQCVKRNDVNMTVRVTAVRLSEAWSLLDNPQKLFPKAGEVEVRLSNPSGYHPNDWVTFQMAPKEPRGKWKASTYRALIPFLDLESIGDLASLRRCLTEDGVEGLPQAGACAIRFSEDRIIMLNLALSPDNRYRMAPVSNFYVYAYDHECVQHIPSDATEVSLYELKRGIERIQELDWSPDDGYIKRIVRAMSRAHDPDLETVVGWLKRHADDATGQVGANPEDCLVAQQGARSGELAKRLLADREVFRELTETLLADPKLLSCLEKETRVIAEQEREVIRAAVQKELVQEIRSLRETRMSSIDAEIKALETEQREALKNQLKQDTQSNLLAMEGRVAARQAEMALEFEARRRDWQLELDALAEQRNVLEEEVGAIEARIEKDSQVIAELQVREALVIKEIERLNEQAASIQVPKSIRLESVLCFNPPLSVPVQGIEDIQLAIESCILLTPKGKEQMMQFLVLMLAGEVPVLQGSEVQDFLLVAEGLLSSGRSARLEADPTVITFEDLWLRAGTQLPTALTYGLELTRMNESTTVLAVIEHAERSGARFWLPTLAGRTRRGELPRRFFICATVEDGDCEEAKAIRSETVWLQVNGSISPTASALVPIVLAPANLRQLDPGHRPFDLVPAMTTIAPLTSQLNLANGLRLARVATEWVRVSQGAQFDDVPSEFASHFMSSSDRS